MIINQSQNSNSKFFTFSWPLWGEGGVNPSGQPDRFFTVFFLNPSLMAFLDILDRMIYFRICLCLITILNENFGIHAKWSFLELRSHQRMPAFSHWTGHWTQSGRLRDTETASSKSTAYPDTGRRAHSYIHVLITKTIQTHRNLFYNKESWSTIMTRRKLVLQERNDQDVKILLTQRHN